MKDLLLYQQLQERIQQGTPVVQVTMVAVKGSAPQDVGAKALVTADGLALGTVGGGKVEARAIEYAQRILSSAEEAPKQLVTWNLQQDIGMTCGGEVSFFFEAYATRPWTLVIFGAGHVAQALVPILTELECVVHCVDPRQEWLERFVERPNLVLHCLTDPKESAQVVPKGAFVCLMTQGHSTDVPILKHLLPRTDLPYVGMIGSQTKAFRVRKELQRSGFSEQQAATLRAPIGLPIGRNHPTEIAISIVAQLLESRDS